MSNGMNFGFDVAVVGATGVIGETMISILEEREFPVRNLFPLASRRSAGTTIEFKGKPHTVGDLEDFDFANAQIALFSAGASISARHAPRAGEAGCVVVDNSSQFRYDDDVPLVVPEVNPTAIAQYRNHNIIANPNCSTIQMVVALQPIHAVAASNGSTSRPISRSRVPGRTRSRSSRRKPWRCSTARRPRPGSIPSRSLSTRSLTSTSSWTTGIRRRR